MYHPHGLMPPFWFLIDISFQYLVKIRNLGLKWVKLSNNRSKLPKVSEILYIVFYKKFWFRDGPE